MQGKRNESYSEPVVMCGRFYFFYKNKFILKQEKCIPLG
ncbi:hypothetical protein HMPREF9413_0587 [Paenibacillus sp. HGF7]|nr:hypothetical protein HMPREF9413_0587 [Paenibacillus sp. HGF7]